MNIQKKSPSLKSTIIQWGILFSIVFVLCTLLTLCNKSVDKKNTHKTPTEKYVEIDGISYDYDVFNLYVSKGVESGELQTIDTQKVKEVIYIGNKNELNPNLICMFPDIRKIKISNCVIDELPVMDDLDNLKVLEISNCNIKDDVNIQAYSVKELTLDFSRVSTIQVKLPNVKVLILNYMDLPPNLIDSFDACKKVERISLIGSRLDSIELLIRFKDVTALRLLKTETSGFDKLSELKNLNEIYLDDEVDRENVDFMCNNFKNGDMKTRAYFIEKRYKLDDKRIFV